MTMKVRVFAARKQPVEIDGLSESDTWDTVRNRAKMALQSNSTHSILLLHGEQVSPKPFQHFRKLPRFECVDASVLLSKRCHSEPFLPSMSTGHRGSSHRWQDPKRRRGLSPLRCNLIQDVSQKCSHRMIPQDDPHCLSPTHHFHLLFVNPRLDVLHNLKVTNKNHTNENSFSVQML